MTEELDLLKKAWKKDEHSYEQVTEKQIYAMIHKRSSSIVKWILMISIAELILWSGISFLFVDENYLKTQIQKDDLTASEFGLNYQFHFHEQSLHLSNSVVIGRTQHVDSLWNLV